MTKTQREQMRMAIKSGYVSATVKTAERIILKTAERIMGRKKQDARGKK